MFGIYRLEEVEYIIYFDRLSLKSVSVASSVFTVYFWHQVYFSCTSVEFRKSGLIDLFQARSNELPRTSSAKSLIGLEPGVISWNHFLSAVVVA